MVSACADLAHVQCTSFRVATAQVPQGFKEESVATRKHVSYLIAVSWISWFWVGRVCRIGVG